MRANPNDAPPRLTPNHRKLAIGFVAAAALAAGIVHLAVKQDWWSDRLAESGPPIYQPSPVATSSPSSEELFWDSVEQDQQATSETSTERQTVFNDTNYKPRQPVNRIPPPPDIPARPQRPVTPAGLNGSMAAMIPWTTARNRTTYYPVRYRWNNSTINRLDFCTLDSPHRPGSIQYRECRKAAKAYLRKECREGRNKSQQMRRMYCHAESAFRH